MEKAKESYDTYNKQLLRGNLMIKSLSGNTLKTIALISMLLDHIGTVIIYPMYVNACFVDGVNMLGELAPDGAKKLYLIYILLRIIGRLAFPIFAFMITEGFSRTHNLKKYFGRLFLFAVISEIPYNLANGGNVLYLDSQNVLWTFLVALIMLWAIKKYAYKPANKIMNIIITAIIVCIAALATILSDGGFGGILLIASMYLFKKDKKKYWIGCIVSSLIMVRQFMWIQLFAFVALILIKMYDGKRGRGNKYLFYLSYPVHFLLLTSLSVMLGL